MLMPTTTYAATTGSSSKPDSISAGKSKTVNSKDYWFKCTVSGAVDFSITTASNATITVYKKKIFGKKKILSKTSTKYLKKTYSDTADCAGRNTYWVHVKMKNKNKITCRITQHVDRYVRASGKGAMWQVNKKTPVPNRITIDYSYWYVPAYAVSTVDTYVNSSKYLEIQTRLVNGAITVATAIALSPLNGYAALAGSIVSGLAMNRWGADFQKVISDKLKKVGGYSYSTRKYKYGVILIEYSSQGVTYYDVIRWGGKTMYGSKGMIGKWTIKYN